MSDRLSARAAALALLGALLLLVGCGPGDSVVIGGERPRVGDDPVEVGASSARRFGSEQPTAPAPEPAPAAFRFELPEGWKDAGATGFRAVNLSAGAGSECYVILLAGEAGGALANLNRWRGEVGLEPLTGAAAAEAIAAMPKVSLLGKECPLLEVSGEYKGMGGPGGAGRTVLGTLLIRPGSQSVFVKMVGPSEEVRGEREAFIAFVKSLEEGR